MRGGNGTEREVTREWNRTEGEVTRERNGTGGEVRGENGMEGGQKPEKRKLLRHQIQRVGMQIYGVFFLLLDICINYSAKSVTDL